MIAHTPGPWIAVDAEIVAADSNTSIALLALHDGLNPTEWQANLHLMAAAPDLLAACYRALEEAGDLRGATRRGELRAAVAKAEGR